MQVAVVTPYYKEPDETLERCLASVRRQTHPATHILVADGYPREFIDRAGVRHLRLDRSHGDAGNAARGLGALLAVAEEFEAIAFLDADNWFDESHVATCLATARKASDQPDFVVARRRLMRPDASVCANRRKKTTAGSTSIPIACSCCGPAFTSLRAGRPYPRRCTR